MTPTDHARQIELATLLSDKPDLSVPAQELIALKIKQAQAFLVEAADIADKFNVSFQFAIEADSTYTTKYNSKSGSEWHHSDCYGNAPGWNVQDY
jgi:hypothetical protein